MPSIILGTYPPRTKVFLDDAVVTLLEMARLRQARSIPIVDGEGRLRGAVAKQEVMRWLGARLRGKELPVELYKRVEDSGLGVTEAFSVELKELSGELLLERALVSPTGEVYVTFGSRLVGEVSPIDLLRLSAWASECNVRLADLRLRRIELLGHDAPLTAVVELLARSPVLGIAYEGSLVGVIGPEEPIAAVLEHARYPEALEVVKAWTVARPAYASGYEDEDLCRVLKGLRVSQEPYLVVLGRDERVLGYLELREMLEPLRGLLVELARAQLVV